MGKTHTQGVKIHTLSSHSKMNFRQIPESYTNTWIWYELLPNSAIKNHLSHWRKLKKNLNKILKNCTISSIHSWKKEGREDRREEGETTGRKARRTERQKPDWDSKAKSYAILRGKKTPEVIYAAKKKKNQWPKIIKQNLLNKCHFPTRYHDDLNRRCPSFIMATETIIIKWYSKRDS